MKQPASSKLPRQQQVSTILDVFVRVAWALCTDRWKWPDFALRRQPMRHVLAAMIDAICIAGV